SFLRNLIARLASATANAGSSSWTPASGRLSGKRTIAELHVLETFVYTGFATDRRHAHDQHQDNPWERFTRRPHHAREPSRAPRAQGASRSPRPAGAGQHAPRRGS